MSEILITTGSHGVRIRKDKYGTEFAITRHGHHWTGFEVDEKLLSLMVDAIKEWKKSEGDSDG